jgi:hypothetical protein
MNLLVIVGLFVVVVFALLFIHLGTKVEVEVACDGSDDDNSESFLIKSRLGSIPSTVSSDEPTLNPSIALPSTFPTTFPTTASPSLVPSMFGSGEL